MAGEVGWETAAGRIYAAPGPDGVVGHHEPEARPLFPPGRVLANPASAPSDDWAPAARDANSEYAPAYAPVHLPGAGVITVFPRGDSIAVVGAFALPEDTTFHATHEHPTRDSVPPLWRGRTDEAGLFLIPADDPTAPPLAVRGTGATSGAFVVEAPAGRWIASLEVLSTEARRAGRTRLGIDQPALPPDVFTVSELLLLDGPLPPSATLADAIPRLLGRSWVRPGDRIAIAWELFGLGYRDEPLGYRLTVVPEGEGLLRRAARVLRLVGPERTQRLEWGEESPDRRGPVLRSVELELPPLSPGPYRLRLEVVTRGRGTLVRELALELRP